MSSMPFTIDDPRERDRSGKATVSSALMDYVNVITSNAIPSADKNYNIELLGGQYGEIFS